MSRLGHAGVGEDGVNLYVGGTAATTLCENDWPFFAKIREPLNQTVGQRVCLAVYPSGCPLAISFCQLEQTMVADRTRLGRRSVTFK